MVRAATRSPPAWMPRRSCRASRPVRHSPMGREPRPSRRSTARPVSERWSQMASGSRPQARQAWRASKSRRSRVRRDAMGNGKRRGEERGEAFGRILPRERPRPVGAEPSGRDQATRSASGLSCFRVSAMAAETIKNRETGSTDEQQAAARQETEIRRSMEGKAKGGTVRPVRFRQYRIRQGLPRGRPHNRDGSPIVTRHRPGSGPRRADPIADGLGDHQAGRRPAGRSGR